MSLLKGVSAVAVLQKQNTCGCFSEKWIQLEEITQKEKQKFQIIWNGMRGNDH